nr:MAG TPA: hypothetical protein [Caudoviricetes sp.]
MSARLLRGLASLRRSRSRLLPIFQRPRSAPFRGVSQPRSLFHLQN